VSALAPTLQAFFSERLIAQRDASPRTVAAYRDTLRLLLAFASKTTGKQPCQLDIADLDAQLIGAFLDHLENDRGNTPRTRNARLAAIHSLYRFASLRHPEHAQTLARVIEIPPKRHKRPLISYLDEQEIKALLAAPDRGTWLGRRDHALLLTAIQTGLRVSELTALRDRDIRLSTGAHARVTGKGRKERCAMLTPETVAVLRTWCRERPRPARRSAVPNPARRTAHTQGSRLAARQAHQHRRHAMPVAVKQARHATRCARR
jgi:site-specific recombinase XerD